jgi:hypothetical protein
MHPIRPRRLTLIDQPVFWPRHGGKSLIDPLRPFARSSNYKWLGMPFPDCARSLVPARGQVEDHVAIAPGSYLLIISAQCDQAFPGDFRFEVTDAGNNRTFTNDWVRYTAATGGTRLTNEATRFGAGRGLPLIVPSPWAISAPGKIVVKIVNLATIDQNIQLFLQFAVPKGGK